MIQRNINLLRDNGIAGIPPLKFDTIIFSFDDFVIRQLGHVLHLSIDAGETYSKSINVAIVGEIRTVQVFDNHQTLLCGHTKSYYINPEWTSIQESDVRNLDGTTFVPTLPNDNFTMANGAEKQYLNGAEVLMWGNYNNYENINPAINAAKVYVWYTEDNGATIKCIFRFWESTALKGGVPTVMSARHIHHVAQHPDQSFWILTGDEPRWRDSMWMRAVHDSATNTFTFTQIGVGDSFKSGYMKFVGEYLYHAFDFTGGGLRRVKTAEAGDITKHEIVYVAGNDLLGFAMGERGDCVLVLSKFFGPLSGKTLYYSPDLITWTEILGDMPDGYTDNSIYARVHQPNSKGKVLAAININYSKPWHTFNYKPSVWLDEIVKRAGFPDAFKPL